jgi:hypothetical protein
LRQDAIALRPSIPLLLSFAIAAVGVVGVIAVALSTDAGTAPGSGQKFFDAPGCLPKSYAGPGSSGSYLLNRNCPTPTAVIVHRTERVGGAWRVTWDGSRSFDPIGGHLVHYAWRVEGSPPRPGRELPVLYGRPGQRSVVLYVTDDSGLTGTATGTVTLP